MQENAVTTDWLARIAHARVRGGSLGIRGGGSKDFYGEPTDEAAVIDTRDYAGMIEYSPTELVMTARAGTSLAEIRQTLMDAGQYWPCDPPGFDGQATLGGCIAAGLAGPGRATRGSVRDSVLGVAILTGSGQALHFGGQVMKNVAGYDVSRLMVGSLGTLGILTQVSFKVLPLPQESLTLAYEESIAAAQARFLAVSNSTAPCSAAAWMDGISYLHFSGSLIGVTDARQSAGGEIVDNAIWSRLRDHKIDSLRDAESLWRVSVLPDSTDLLDETQVLEWHGGQRWLCDPEFDPRTRIKAGYATLFRAPKTSLSRFSPLSPVVAGLHQRLKKAFDPDRIFSPGRLYPDL
ncbi:MAG: glycolate oxidase FAD binding subunit [Candidatus Azotimanducaceae bacterium]|jgi:glycolate oxidase FAD binding subunit